MGSRSPDLSFVRAIEEAEASALRSPMANAAGSGLMEENTGLKRGCPSKEDIGDKENICEVSQDTLYVPKFRKEVALQMKKAKRVGGCNLRKSLAWNPAFLTEEGVLNTLELSVLSGSLAGSNENAILEIDGEMSPSVGFQKSGDKSVLCSVEESNGRKVYAKSGMKNVKDQKLFSTPEVSFQEEKQAQSLRKINSGRSITRSLPLSPAMKSQKSVRNANATNSASKIPKFMPIKFQASSLPVPSTNTSSTTKCSSKLNQCNASVNAEKSFGTKGFPSNLKKELPSSKPLAHDVVKDVEPKVGSKIIPDSFESVEVHGRTNSVGSGKVFPLCAQYGQRVSGALPPPAHVKPSALRMPSPSLGFFSQGKVSPFGNHSQRNIKNTSSGIPPLRKPISLKLIDDPRIIHASAEQQSNNATATTKSCAGTAINGSIQRSSAANFTPCSAATVNIHPSVSKSSQTQFIRASEGYSCHSSGDELSKSGYLLVDNDNKVQSQLLEKNDRGRDDYETTIKETETVKQSLKVNFSPITEADGNEISSTHISSELCSLKDLYEEKSKQLAEDGLENSLTKNSPVETKETEASSKDIQSAKNYDSIIRVGSQSGAGNVEIASSVETGSSLTWSKEQTAGADNRSLMSDHSLGQEKVVPVESSTSEVIQPNLPEDRNNSISLEAEGASMPEDTEMDKSRVKAVLLKHQSHVVPFSDEWLAAVEAFGEEILELKTGPVQNSPTDKTLPEPSPWSPVKRKALDIGPFDCTKYSKNLSSSDTAE
ncbi:chitinase-like protein PB1E7.04c isoform X2 [Ananas comosus]|uniref:Chitinase-like protein PB1E7.04c isoform X2 n=1 Tax=Ananas comosus TaxID=4615 RepID=A0A6P5G6B3_ANACO|nr:chitinase-like protein PB1E7.04c isoform X2 [Ananas comosus]